MPGKASKKAKQHISGGRLPVYEALKKHGMSKSTAAAIANAGKTKGGRSKMAKKAARTRKRKS